jgi:hypothetical protein
LKTKIFNAEDHWPEIVISGRLTPFRGDISLTADIDCHAEIYKR